MGLRDLLRPKWRNTDPAVRAEAIATLDDDAALARVAAEDPSPELRLAAVRRLTDADALLRLALGEEGSGADEAVSGEAAARLTDPAHRLAVARGARFMAAQQAAVQAMDRDGDLAAVARGHRNTLIRWLAVDRIGDLRLRVSALPSKTPEDLARAAFLGVVSRVEALLHACVDPNALGARRPGRDRSTGLIRRTALHEAAERGDLPIVRALVAAGADPLNRGEEVTEESELVTWTDRSRDGFEVERSEWKVISRKVEPGSLPRSVAPKDAVEVRALLEAREQGPTRAEWLAAVAREAPSWDVRRWAERRLLAESAEALFGGAEAEAPPPGALERVLGAGGSGEAAFREALYARGAAALAPAAAHALAQAGATELLGVWLERVRVLEIWQWYSDHAADRVAPSLLCLLLADDADLRKRAVDALATVSRDWEVLHLERHWKSAFEPVRAGAARLVRRHFRIGHPAFRPAPLLDALADPSRRVRREVALAAHRVREYGKSDEIPALLALLQDPDAQERHNEVIVALGILGEASVVPALLDALRGDDADLRHDAVVALGWTKDARALEPLLEVLATPGAAELRGAAAEALGRVADERALPALVAALGDPADAAIHRTVAEALFDFEHRDAFTALAAALRHADPAVRAEALDALDWQAPASIDGLAAVLAEHADPVTRQDAARALGALGDAQAIAPLLGSLGDPDGAVRAAVADALGLLGDGDTEARLRSMRARPDATPEEREAIARALAGLRARTGA